MPTWSPRRRRRNMCERDGGYPLGCRLISSMQGLVLSLIMAAGFACRGQSTPMSPGTPAQQREIQGVIRQNPGWRLATVADHVGNPEEVKRLQADRPTYTPYFATEAPEGHDGSF